MTAEADAKVDAAMEQFARLREALHEANTRLLRELLAETIERVEVWTDASTGSGHATTYAAALSVCAKLHRMPSRTAILNE